MCKMDAGLEYCSCATGEREQREEAAEQLWEWGGEQSADVQEFQWEGEALVDMEKDVNL